MSRAEKTHRTSRTAAVVRASAGLGVAAGWLLAAGAWVAGAHPPGGVPPWAWIALGFAFLLLREACPAPARARLRRGRRPR